MSKEEKTEKGHSIPDIFKDYSNCDPEGVKIAIDNLWEDIYTGADVDREKFHHAMNRVYFDGYFGPISQEDWDDEDQGARGLTVKESLEILEKGIDAVSAVEYYNPEYDDYCPEEEEMDNYIPENNCRIEARDIKRSLFKFYYEIYGG